MLFHAPEFLLFFALFLAGLPLFRGESRMVYVTLASCFFYGWWDPRYLPVLVGLTLYAHFFATRKMGNRFPLALIIGVAFLPLVIFKYTNFLLMNVAALTGLEPGFHADWRLPLGISFITFTVAAYIIDAQSGRVETERRFWHTALYVVFFPHLIAGPILRARKVLPQLKGLGLRLGMVRFAALLFAVGAVKKVVFADQLAPLVDHAYQNLPTLTQGEAWMAFYGFLVQIYCDFSGYTDMAFALAMLLGVRFPLNFNSPYASGSFGEFWQRWHISLSQWLRDYLYIPLGGSRSSMARTAFALMTTMLLGGLWHGAAWTFVLWGGLHGALLVTEHLGRRLPFVLPRWLRILLVVHGVGIQWVFFRAPDLSAAAGMLRLLALPGDWGALFDSPLPVILAGLALAVHPWDNAVRIRWASRRLPVGVTAALVTMAILICAAFSAENPSAFIYFDF